jgi:branched-chain amino acid transport system ATP-binding protein
MNDLAPAAASTAYVDANDLHAHYGESHVLRGISLTIGRGETIGLLGRNGMGKTTLIRALLGLLRASGGRVRGTVRVAGCDVSRAAPERIVRLGIGYVPEGRGIFPNLSVRENLLMGARAGPGGRRDWTLERALQLFPRLQERLGHGGQQLSGGEQQMLAIARALLTNPDLIVLDEATEGLAPKVVAEIWRIIGLIRASGIAALIVDRNYRAVVAHSDRCVVLEKGRVVLECQAQQLAAEPEPLRRLLGV